MRKAKGFTLIELMIVVAIIGVLTAVAVPAFVKYIRKSKTVEAIESLAKIKMGARQYFVADKWLTNGTIAPKAFPIITTNPSPPSAPASCCANGGKCWFPTSSWDSWGWAPLHFGITESPHYYGYTFLSSGTSTSAVYTATAQGDLDCDGKTSTWEIRGSIDDEGSVRAFGPIMTDEIE